MTYRQMLASSVPCAGMEFTEAVGAGSCTRSRHSAGTLPVSIYGQAGRLRRTPFDGCLSRRCVAAESGGGDRLCWR